MAFRCSFSSALVALALTGYAESAHAQGLMDKLKKAAQGKEYTVRGRLRVQDGQWLTCFDGIKTGYLGAHDLARPGDATVDPATGRMRVSTAAIPTVIMTRNGIVTSNDCDSLAKQGLLLPPTAAKGKGDTGYSDEFGCTKAEWTGDEIIARRREIMDCQADSLSERAWRRSQVRNAGAGGSASAQTTGSDDERKEANARLQEETAAKFKAIQAQAATPTTAPTKSDDAIAKDGATVCGLTPAYMLKLKGEAVAFVSYNASKGTLVFSELAGGERRTVELDGAGFAQRASFNAQAIGQGGDTCGRAFWNAEAYKAASAAMSGR